MWRILFDLAKQAIKKNVSKTFKIFKDPKVIKNVVKPRNIRNKISPVKRAQRKMSTAKKLGRMTKLAFSPKARLVEDITRKAMMLENLVSLQYERWEPFINFNPSTSTTVSEINKSVGFLKGKSKTELKLIEEIVGKELGEWHITSAEQLTEVVKKEEEMQDIVDTSTHEEFMDNWKTAFYDSETTAYLTKDEKDIIWAEIEQDRDFDWWQNRGDKYRKTEKYQKFLEKWKGLQL